MGQFLPNAFWGSMSVPVLQARSKVQAIALCQHWVEDLDGAADWSLSCLFLSHMAFDALVLIPMKITNLWQHQCLCLHCSFYPEPSVCPSEQWTSPLV